MLAVSASEARAICQLAGWQWCEDATNADTALLRAAVRHKVLPMLEAISPGAAGRIAGAAPVQRAAAETIGKFAAQWLDKEPPWKRAELATQSPAIIAEILMRSAAGPGADAVRRDSVAAAVRAITEGVSRRKAFVIGGVVVRVSGAEVSVERRVRQAEDDAVG
jgi:tRNA(Ile)-lysidine synthase